MMKNILVEIPYDKAEQVRQFLESLSLDKEENKMEEEKKEDDENKMDEEDGGETDEEVKKIINHKIQNQQYYWNVKWRDNTTEFVNDEDTNCEKKISEYRKHNNINTSYCFCRVSTNNQVGQNHVSLDAQESEITKYSQEQFGKRHRHKTYKISKSAYKIIPRQLRIIGDACIQGDSIFIYRVDRLSRNIVKYLSWLEDLNNRGIDIYSVSEKISYKNNKTQFIQNILDAQKESELIGKRIRMSIKRRRERGDEFIGRLPYGKKYERNKNGVLKIINNEDEQRIIKIILRMKNNENKNLKEICEFLNNKKIFKYKNKKWNKTMIKRILRK